MAVSANIASRLDQFHWMSDSTTRYERLKSGVATLNPWKRRLLYILPALFIVSWTFYLFNPTTDILPVSEAVSDPAEGAQFTIPDKDEDDTPTITLQQTATITEIHQSQTTITEIRNINATTITKVLPAKTITQILSGLTVTEVQSASTTTEVVSGVTVTEVQKSETTIYKESPGAGAEVGEPKYDETKVAFIMESREVGHLPALLLHMISVVPEDWKFLFWGSDKSIAFVRSSLPVARYEKMGKLEMKEIPANISFNGHQALSETFTNLWLYETALAPAEWLLVFQTDSILCANSGKNLNDMLIYDWLGAPWPWSPDGGNGGLSLRRVSSLIKILKEKERPKNDPELEDLWLSNRLAEMPWAKMANQTTLSSFSVENMWFDRPMGYHTGWSGGRLPDGVWGTPEKRQAIFEYCPEMKLTMNLKLPGEDCPKAKRGEDAYDQFYVRAW